MKRLLVTDTHLGMYSDHDAWLDIVLNFFKHAVKYCYKNEITEIIHLGDFFDNRKSLNTKTQHQAHRIAKILEVSKNLHTYIIVGNHDCYYKNQIQPNTLELFKEYGAITVVDSIIKHDDMLLVPWGEVPEETQGARFCMGHFAIKGFHMNDSYKCKDGLDKVKFKDFDGVYSGHFHTPSSKDNITYLGAPYGQTFHDAGGIRGMHTFDDGKLKFVEYSDAPKFVKMHTTPEPLDENEVKGNIVRIVFDKDYGTTTNQDIIDNILSNKPFLYSVDFTNIESEGDEVSSEGIEMESKEQIVDQYIDSQIFPTNIQIGILKSMFKKLMKEAGQGTIKSRTADGTKIECTEIGFQNFLSFGSKWQDVPLHNGVNFVTGIDMDKGKSNGAGKSSFLETIPFALFGKTARDINQSQIVNWKNKKNCNVVFRFKINDVLYEIKRSLKPGKLEIWKDGGLMDQDAHKSDYQGMFEEIFGMDVKMFMSLVHSNVNSSANIMGMKKPDKRKFLERMFGLEIYSKMNKISNEKLRNVDEKRYKIDVDMQAADDKVDSANEMIKKFKTEIESKKKSIESVAESQEELDKLKESNPNIEKDVKSTKKDVDEKTKHFHKVTLEFEKWKATMDAEVDHLKKEIKNFEDQENQRKKNKEIQERIDKIIQKAGTLEEIQKKIAEKNKESLKLSGKIEKYNVQVSDVEKEVVEFQTDLKHVEKNLELLKEGICPTCGQDVTDPNTHYKKEAVSFKRKIENREKKVTSFKNERSSLLSAQEDLTSINETLSNVKDKLHELERQLKEVGSDKKKKELGKTLQDNKKKLEDAIKLYNERKITNKNEVEALNNKLKDIEESLSLIKAKEKDLDIIKSQAAEVKKHIESLKVMIQEQNDLIEVAKSKHNIAESNKVRLNDIADYLNSIKTILKDENIKQFTIKQIIPYLNKQTNYYLSEVNYGFYVKIDGWLDIEIKGPGIRGATYDSLSGGERRGIDIALQLSLLDIARTQAGVFPDLLVFDELLDSSIDAIGINQLMKIVKTKQKEFGGKIFIITHRPEIDGELMDYEYKVIKENGYSRVEI